MKAARILISLLLFACLLALACEEQVKEEEEVGIQVTVREGVLEGVERTRPQEVVVYEVRPVHPERGLKRLADLFGIKGKIEETEDLLFVKEGERYLEVRKASSSAFYGEMSSLWREEPTPEKTDFDVPSNEETKKIAMEWLSKLGFSGEDITTLQTSITDETFEIVLPEKQGEPVSSVVGKNVELRRRIDDLLVYGPGSKIKFFIGEKGQLNGMLAVWRQITPSSAVLGHQQEEGEPKGEKMRPISAKEAFEALKKNPLDHLPLALVHKIDVEAVDFGYYSRPAVEHQKYLQPVYVFRGAAYAKLPDGREVDVPYEQYVVALRKPLEPIWAETRVFRPEARPKDVVPPPEEDVDEKGGD